MDEDDKQAKLKDWRKKDLFKLDIQSETYEEDLYRILDGKVKEYL